jgi:HSP20 family protein
MDDVKQFLHELAREPHIYAHVEDDADAVGQLAIDLYQTDKMLILEAPIGGVRTEDIDVEITPTTVLIEGRRHREHRTKKHDYVIDECHWGSFAREISLPVEIDADRAEASIKNGVLRVKMPFLGAHSVKVSSRDRA